MKTICRKTAAEIVFMQNYFRNTELGHKMFLEMIHKWRPFENLIFRPPSIHCHKVSDPPQWNNLGVTLLQVLYAEKLLLRSESSADGVLKIVRQQQILSEHQKSDNQGEIWSWAGVTVAMVWIAAYTSRKPQSRPNLLSIIQLCCSS
jgi:hypothetical protein